MSERLIRIKEQASDVSEAAAGLFIGIALQAIDEHQGFSVALSGGSTPRSLYSLLAKKYRSAIDWTRVSFFFGDERCVPPDSDESNYRMARETLLDPLGIDSKQVYRWQAELPNAEDAAAIYETNLRRHFEQTRPGFDLVLLGLGDDAHTASLFPHSPALWESKRLAVVNHIAKPAADRLTVTFPVINNSANVLFLVSGKGKAEAVSHVLEGGYDPNEYPAQFVRPVKGKLYWLLDIDAARMLVER